MFDVDGFIEECKRAICESDAHKAVREVVQRTVAHPYDVLRGLGEPKRAGVETIYHGDDLTILNVLWGPRMTIHPHNHLMWAVIGIYGGQEDNTFYKRTDEGIEVASAKQLVTKDTAPLGVPVIHSVTNPLDKITAAIHVYGGDFFDTPRSEWDPDSLQEHPYDVEHTRRVFEESNKLLEA
jgi:predicted metal-dependent enzyme (double-stranded beta helix superfamily)